MTYLLVILNLAGGQPLIEPYQTIEACQAAAQIVRSTRVSFVATADAICIMSDGVAYYD